MKNGKKSKKQLVFELKELSNVIETLKKEKTEFIDSLPQIFFETDDKGNLVFVNRQFEIEFGYTKQEILHDGFSIGHVVALEDIQNALEHFMMTIMGKETNPFECTALRKDGSSLSIIVYPKVVVHNAKVIGTRGFIVNVTEQKRAAKALQESEERLSLAVKGAFIGIWDWDIKNKKSIWNSNMFKIYGIPEKNPICFETWEKTVVPEDLSKVNAVFQNIIANKGNGFSEFRIIRPDGTIRHIQTGMGAITNDNNRVTRIVGINIDITERKQNEEEREKLILKLQEALAKVKQLTGLLPICCHCKKIKNDKGAWTQLEAYIHEHSEARFSHGLCEECLHIFYPDFS